ncbi:MFS general substrate transporter [Gonapodya prolifera JEL478]|uniref:MFS general substrate transporter n=1 Tax=Gonapodya prolifera (strain JEL478) TaxID=1344416 RepID=A0A139AX90_GONPJ|nr:MFS general substrate transporter [Gonapodya prolifera JEL478]|eukprot:KXS21362.1 MFS general substrate transporter [Gonapodya prolifera JEL478]
MGEHEESGKEGESLALKTSATSSSTDLADASKNESDAKSTPFQLGMLFFGLALSVFMAALDITIVAVATPSIITDFKTFSGLSWVGTAYLLSSTPFFPTYGKLADIFGRKPILLSAILIFEAGSLMCGLAPNMAILIAGRAVSGLGGGALLPLAYIVVSDVVPLRERPKYMSIFAAAFGIACIAGPLLGGAFTDRVSWRWCFLINLPVGALTALVVIFYLGLPIPHGDIRNKLGKIDYLGTLFIATATVLLASALSLGGVEYAWSSAAIISMFVLSFACAVLFVASQLKFSKNPLISADLWGNRALIPVWLCGILQGALFFSLTYYVPIYFQVVNGDKAVAAGVHTLPLILGHILLTFAGGIAISSTGYTAPIVYLSACCFIVGAALTSTLTSDSGLDKQYGYLVLLGMGSGLASQSINLNGQSVVAPPRLAVMISSYSFCQALGGILGIAVDGSVLTNALSSRLIQLIDSETLLEYVTNHPSEIRDAGKVPVSLVQPVVDAYTASLSLVFKAAAATAGAFLVTSLFLRRDRMKGARRGKA